MLNYLAQSYLGYMNSVMFGGILFKEVNKQGVREIEGCQRIITRLILKIYLKAQIMW